MVMVHSIVTLYFYRRWPYNCDVIADPSELQECEASLAKSPMQGEDSFSLKTPDMNSRTASGNAFYIGVFVLMNRFGHNQIWIYLQICMVGV